MLGAATLHASNSKDIADHPYHLADITSTKLLQAFNAVVLDLIPRMWIIQRSIEALASWI